MADRDYLAAVRDHVVVFDGGMGATLEAFDLSLEDDYKLPGRAHEVLVLNRPDVIEGVHTASDDPTLGNITFRELVDVFAEQSTGLLKGGVDLVIIETAQDILEVK